MNSVNCRLLAGALAGLALLAGCSALKSSAQADRIYVLHAAPAGTGQPVAAVLSVPRPAVQPGLDTDRIAVLRAGNELDYYAASRFGEPLPKVLAALALQSAGRCGWICHHRQLGARGSAWRFRTAAHRAAFRGRVCSRIGSAQRAGGHRLPAGCHCTATRARQLRWRGHGTCSSGSHERDRAGAGARITTGAGRSTDESGGADESGTNQIDSARPRGIQKLFFLVPVLHQNVENPLASMKRYSQ